MAASSSNLFKTWQGRYFGNRLTRRKFLVSSGMATGAAALLACSGGGSAGLKFDEASTAREPGTVWFSRNDWKLEDETKEAVKGGIYPSNLSSDQAGSYDALLPAPSQVPYSAHVHEYLMQRRRAPGIDPKSPEADVPVPALAEAMEMGSDGATVTFTLRPNVKFHRVSPVNGRVMDLDDWKTTLERFLALSAQREPLSDILDKVEYPDSRHMILKLKFPYAPFVNRIWSERFAFQIFPKELNLNQNLAESVAIGTGFKILDKHQPSVTMEYRKHPEYWGGEPLIDRWHYPIIPEYANRYAQFVAQNTISFSPSARDVLGLARDVPGAVIVAGELPDDNRVRLNWGRIDADKLPYRDPRVRMAVRRAINMKGIAESQANKAQFEAAGVPVETATRTFVTHNLSWWLDPEKGELGPLSTNYFYDVAEARRLVQAAGYTAPLDLYWQIMLGSAGQEPEDERLMIDSANQSGVFKVLLTTETNTVAHRNCRSLGECRTLTSTSLSEDMDYFLRELHSAGNRPGGERPYTDPTLDRIADAYRRELDAQKRISLLKEWQMFNSEFFPQIPSIDQYTSFSFRWPWMHNINHGAVSGRPYYGGHLQWLDANMPRRNG
jgi:peptide/nickel transport system substrate-binding protein